MRQRRTSAVDMRGVGRILVRGTRRAALTLVGFVLVGIGLAGLVVPVLPGWVLIIGGFAVLSREYSWAASGLTFARRHAARGGTKLRSLTARPGRRLVEAGEPSGAVVIDLTKVQNDAGEAARDGAERRASNIG